MRLLTAADLLADAKPIPWLIPGFVLENCLHFIYGSSGIGKTHVLVSMGHALATGTSFADLGAREPLEVLYVIAEGFGGIPSRVRSWMDAHEERELARVRYLGESVAFHDPDGVDELLACLESATFQPKLIIIDTLSATAPPGFDENSAQHFGEFLHGVVKVKDALQCAVLISHHAGWEGSRERGSSAFRGRVDVVMSLERAGQKTLRLSTPKVRDFASSSPLLLELVPAGTSVIIQRGSAAGMLVDSSWTVLAALRDSPTALKPKDWMNRCGLGRSKFFAVKAELVREELVAENEHGAWYPTAEGLARLALSGPSTDRPRTVHGLGVSDRSGESPPVSGSLRPGLWTPGQETAVHELSNGHSRRGMTELELLAETDERLGLQEGA